MILLIKNKLNLKKTEMGRTQTEYVTIVLIGQCFQVRKTVLNGMLSELVTYLTERYRDDTSKLRSLYVWLTSQNLRLLRLPLKPAREGHVLHYLEKLKKKKGNYAQLFSHLCKYVQFYTDQLLKMTK